MLFKTLLAISATVFIVCSLIIIANERKIYYDELDFINYLQMYNKQYENETEYQKRLEAFRMSVSNIEALNSFDNNETDSNDKLVQYGWTKFSDLSLIEFTNEILQSDYAERVSKRNDSTLLYQYANLNTKEHSSEESSEVKQRRYRSVNIKNELPQKVDWREKGVISEVQNQRGCGACWAFSVVETVEAIHSISASHEYNATNANANSTVVTNKPITLSTQQAIDCAGYTNDGCAGGDMCALVMYMKDTHMRLTSETNYPLHLRTEKCKYDVASDMSNGVGIDSYKCDNLAGNEDIMLGLLARLGPVAVAVNAILWQNYVSGIIQYHCNDHPLLMNHAVQIVGYDLTHLVPHYIVRNSWGTDWGENGYVRLAIGNNICGIANEVVALKTVGDLG